MKKFFVMILFAVLVSSVAHAQSYADRDVITLWEKGIPDADGVAASPVQYADAPAKVGDLRNNDRYVSEVKVPTLEIFEPAANIKNGKAIVVCPGGGYQLLSYIKEGQDVARWLTQLGYTAYVLAYRCPDNRLGALQDVQRAIRMVRSRYGFDTVGVIGFSAGGSLSCRAATCFDRQTYQPQDSIDSASARPSFGILIYPAYLNEGEGGTLTPELTVTKATSPLFVFGTQDDIHYSGPSSLVIADAMYKAGAPIELHYLPKGGHGYGMTREVGRLWVHLAEVWLKVGSINSTFK